MDDESSEDHEAPVHGATDAPADAPGAEDIATSRAPQSGARRRRRANVRGGRHHSHRVKVTPEEEAQLVQLALRHGGISIPRLLVESTLAGDSETAARRRVLGEELFAVHRLMASISNNVNQIARATNVTGDLQPETAATLDAVRRTAARIDAAVDALIVS